MAHPGKIGEGEANGCPFHLVVEVVPPERKKIWK
jgi:hypothetical protein